MPERPEFDDEPLDGFLIEKLPVLGRKDGETNPVVALPAVQERVFVNPADLFVREEVDLLDEVEEPRYIHQAE